MKLTQNKTLFHPALFWNLLKLLSSYRLQMHVTEVMVFPDGNGYYVCPRCHITVEREFMSVLRPLRPASWLERLQKSQKNLSWAALHCTYLIY